MTTRLLILLLAWLVGCGEQSFITLQIDGDYSIPDEVDRLEITVQLAGGGRELASQELELDSSHSFPVRVLFEPMGEIDNELETHVLAYLGSSLVARIDVVYDWEHGKNSIAELPPLEPVN